MLSCEKNISFALVKKHVICNGFGGEQRELAIPWARLASTNQRP